MDTGAGPWSRSRNVASFYERFSGRTGASRNGDAAVSVSLYGSAHWATGFAGRGYCNSSSSGACSAGGRVRLASTRWREVVRRADEFDGGYRGIAGRSAGVGVLWFSTASAEAARDETGGTSAQSKDAYAVSAGNTR